MADLTLTGTDNYFGNMLPGFEDAYHFASGYNHMYISEVNQLLKFFNSAIETIL